MGEVAVDEAALESVVAGAREARRVMRRLRTRVRELSTELDLVRSERSRLAEENRLLAAKAGELRLALREAEGAAVRAPSDRDGEKGCPDDGSPCLPAGQAGRLGILRWEEGGQVSLVRGRLFVREGEAVEFRCDDPRIQGFVPWHAVRRVELHRD